MSDDTADQDLRLGDLATIHELAAEFGMTVGGMRHYYTRWPECVVRLGNHPYFVRSRFMARLDANRLRPWAKNRQKPRPLAADRAGRH